jgi:hypothetical protein
MRNPPSTLGEKAMMGPTQASVWWCIRARSHKWTECPFAHLLGGGTPRRGEMRMGTLSQCSCQSQPNPCIMFATYSGVRPPEAARASHEQGEGEIALQLGVGRVERKLGSPGFPQLQLPRLPRAARGASPELHGGAKTRSDDLNATKEQGIARMPRAVPGEAAATAEDEKEGPRDPPPPTEPSIAAATSRDTMARTRPPRDGGAQRRQRRPARGKPCPAEPGTPALSRRSTPRTGQEHWCLPSHLCYASGLAHPIRAEAGKDVKPAKQQSSDTGEARSSPSSSSSGRGPRESP